MNRTRDYRAFFIPINVPGEKKGMTPSNYLLRYCMRVSGVYGYGVRFNRIILCYSKFLYFSPFHIWHSLDETLDDPVLRQAYDHFGYPAVDIIRHNRYAPYSLYVRLSKLHDEGKPSDALDVLHTMLEDRKQKQRQKEWLWNADVEINLQTCSSQEEWIEVSSTNVSFSANVPVPPQIAPSPFPAQPNGANKSDQPTVSKRQRMQLSIGGQSNIENGMGSTQGILSANYQPLPHISITSDLAIGRNIESSISSSTTLTNGTGLSAKVTRQMFQRQKSGSGGEEPLAFGFSSNRSLTMFHGRTVHAMFALGLGSDLVMHYGVLSFTTWGMKTARGDESGRPPPRLTAKLSMGTQYPIVCSIDQSHLVNSPHRSGQASLAWSPLQGCKLKAMISRKLFRKYSQDESEFAANLGIGVEHTGMVGLKWLIEYHRPEGLTIRIPIFVSSFLSPGYWNRMLSVSLLSFFIDEMIEESWGYSSSTGSEASHTDQSVSAKMAAIEKERKWLHLSGAKRDAARQLSFMIPIVRQKQQYEESIDGLVILRATYSLTYSATSDSCPNRSLDVTQQLQFWVNDSRLYLPPSSKSLLLGFYNLHNHDNVRTITPPSRWRMMIDNWLYRFGLGGGGSEHHSRLNKQEGSAAVTLSVRYKYNGGVYDIIVKDDDVLELPSTSALYLGSSKVIVN